MEAERRGQELWLRLYNAKSEKQLYDLFYEHAGHLTRVVNSFGKYLPKWMDVVRQHAEEYRAFIEHWIAGELTPADRKRVMEWAGGMDWIEGLDNLFPSERKPHFSLEAWLISQMKKNPHEPFTEAYRQVLKRLVLEKAGVFPYRPRFCGGCGTLFEPRQDDQRWCGTKCRNRMLQQEYRAAKRSEEQPAGVTRTRAVNKKRQKAEAWS
jgi:hypothetical protein